MNSKLDFLEKMDLPHKITDVFTLLCEESGLYVKNAIWVPSMLILSDSRPLGAIYCENLKRPFIVWQTSSNFMRYGVAIGLEGTIRRNTPFQKSLIKQIKNFTSRRERAAENFYSMSYCDFRPKN